jgi:acetyltransferase-like isoleucine patch superfamily enzyme
MSKYIQYGFVGIFRLTIDLIRTKFLFYNARIVRFPIDIRGKQFLKVSDGLTTGRYCRIEAYPQDHKSVVISIGKNVQINDFVHITSMEGVTIGNNVLLASKIYISDCSHGFYEGFENDSFPDEKPIERKYKVSPVVIKDNVWIGESVSILPGVTIGLNSIIGANSVVTKDIPDNTIAVGNPAKVIKRFNFDKKVWERI